MDVPPAERVHTHTARACVDVPPLAPYDVWLRDLTGRYPPQAVTNGSATYTAFVDVFAHDARAPADVFAEMLAHLDNQKRGAQWAQRGMIPRLNTWLRDGRWKQLHAAPSPVEHPRSRTVGNVASLQAFVARGSA